MSVKSSRRAFLRALGATCAALPFARLLERSALGQATPTPLRFVGISIGNGTPVEFWRPQSGFTISNTNQSLQPFDDAVTYGTSFKNRLVVVDGISNLVAVESNSGGHAATPCMWTGSINTSSGPQNESFETYLGVTKGLGNVTPFPTILYSMGGSGAYGAGGVQLDMLSNPPWLYTTLFSNYQPDAGSMMAQQAQLDAIARGKSTLDFVTSSLTSLQSRLAAPEQQLLDQHLTAIRQIENRLTTPPATCNTVPAAPNCAPSSPCPNLTSDQRNQLIMDMFVQALACDLTRFIQFALEGPGSIISSTTQDPGVNPPLPIAYPPSGQVCSDNPNNNQDCDHLDVAHAYIASKPFTLGGGTGGNGQSDITSQVRLARLNKYYMQQIAYMAQQLNMYGLLDTTLMMTMDDVGNPALHDCTNLPVILLGGVNGALTMGQYIQLPQQTSQNALFISIANAFGFPITSYGTSSESSYTSGTIPGLLA